MSSKNVRRHTCEKTRMTTASPASATIIELIEEHRANGTAALDPKNGGTRSVYDPSIYRTVHDWPIQDGAANAIARSRRGDWVFIKCFYPQGSV